MLMKLGVADDTICRSQDERALRDMVNGVGAEGDTCDEIELE